MKHHLTVAAFLVLMACGKSEDDRLIGTWSFASADGPEVTTFNQDGTVVQVKPSGDTLSGSYTFVNRNTVKIDLALDGDSLAYLWQLEFHGDSMVVGLPGAEQRGLERLQ